MKANELPFDNNKWARAILDGDVLRWETVTVGDKDASPQKSEQATPELLKLLDDPAPDHCVML